MSLFRKPKKNIQRRVFSGKDEEEDEPMRLDMQPTEKEQKKERKESKSKKQTTLLSFDDEDDGEVFQVKKSSHSKKVMRMFEREKEKEKRKKEVKADKPEPKATEKKEIVTDDLVMVINSNHRPKTPPAPILSGREALCAGKNDLSSDEEQEAPAHGHRFSRPDNFKKVLESGAIPDAAMIHAARKRRQRAREMGGDFVPLEDQEPEDKGRLIRDDDNEGSDEERIDMGANPVIRDQERRREQFYEAQDSDQELNDWEDQQIRKGVTGANLPQELACFEYQVPVPQPNAPPIIKMDPGVPKTPQSVLEKIKEQYELLKSTRKSNEDRLVQINEEVLQSTNELESLKLQAVEAADKFRFYQELRGYITDLVECLDEKVGVIMNLEQRALDLFGKRSEWLIERRRQDVRDQAEEVTNASKGVLGMRRDEDEEKCRRAVEREGRRTRRRRAREAEGAPKHVEGMSSDDEVPQQDIINFNKEKEQILQETQDVFEDVVDDYSTVANILIKFEQWKETDVTAYTEAYATLCLPRVVTPLIRLNLIFWDPLRDTVDLEKLDWYRTLALFGLHDDETENSLSDDPDINLLPALVEKLIIPKLTQLVDKCWDPLSSSETLKLIGIISRYIRRFPSLGPDSKSLHTLFNAVMHKLQQALENDVFIPITAKMESRNPFFQRQFASGLKLLKNITSWQGILNDNLLKDLALNSLLNRYILSAIKFCQVTDAVSKMGLINIILPRIWMQSNTPQLQNFGLHITELAQQLDKNNPLHLESIETLSSILKTLKT